MRTNKLLMSFIVLLFVMIGTSSVYSQLVTSSVIREDVEYWTPLVNPVFIGYQDDPWGQIPMTFPFVYDGTTISNVYAYGNGFISLNTYRDPDGISLPRFPQDPMIISWYLKDLYTTGSLSYKFEGVSPFRVLTIQQLGARLVNDFSGKLIDVQVKLYETTNEVKIIYNRSSGLGANGVDGYLYFAGNLSGSIARYINIKPNSPLVASNFYYSTSNPNVTPWLSSSVVKYFYSGRSFTLTSVPKLSGIYPDASTVLASGKLYSGDDRPYVRVSRAGDQKAITIRYKITGPLGQPTSKVIYTALTAPDLLASEQVNPNPQPIGTGIKVYMPHAKDIAGRLSDGALDMTVFDNFPSGEYQVDAILEYADGTPYTHSISSKFTVSFPSDLNLMNIVEPVYTQGSIYQFSGPGVPVKILVKNQGADPVKKFIATYKIYDGNGNFVTQVQQTFDITSNPLQYNESREFAFSTKYKPSKIGQFSIVSEVNFENANQDKYLVNNIFPREGAPKKIFEVGYSVEAQMLAMLTPSQSIYKGRPVRFSARLKNNGVSDISLTYAVLKVTDPNGKLIKNDSIFVNEIPSGLVNTTDIFWPEPFIPEIEGIYTLSLFINADDDEVPANNTMTVGITVIAGLKGTYTISAAGGNFKTITEAVNAMYERGVDGPVTFWLSDETYIEGNALLNAPAIDFSSKIVGVGPANPVKFTINPLNATRGSVNIHLHSGSGVGILIGQSYIPGNVNAPVLNVNPGQVKNWANPSGYISFDGGSKKSLKFTLATPSQHRAVFYLGNGASNITIKNCLIEDGINQAASYVCRVPSTVFNATFNRFEYDADNSVDGTFSAGVVIRNLPPRDKALGTNPLNLDTITNHNNVISGNEISKFGYGILALGIGALEDPNNSRYVRFYNKNNSYNDNIINTVSRAGIFTGYEEDGNIVGNRIYAVNGACGNDAGGIILGGDARTLKFGYNNLRMYVSGNEISGIKGYTNIYGIKIEQSFVVFNNLTKTYSFPDEAENMKLINNIIWGFEPELQSVNVIGLALLTERKNANNWANMEFEAKNLNYYTRNDLLSNNTIFLLDDKIVNTGAVLAAAIFNTKNAQVFNNAIAIDDPFINANNPVTAAFFYYGLHPNKGGITTDRNAYWIKSADASIFRFIEVDPQGRILEQGYKREFVTMDQWQQWTQQDWYSVFGDFAKDYEKAGSAPFMMRVKSSPVPLGSVLNNRGIVLEENTYDIDGVLRGKAGERYDIGAVEFKGNLQSRDVEVVAMPKPGAYKATAPMPFSDANYIMTTSPVAVTGIIRNSGLLVASAVNATLKIYRESPTGTYIQEGPDVKAPINELLFSEDALIDFRTNDGVNDANNYEFFPKTFGDLRGSGYTVPKNYLSMEANITPLYKFVIEVPNDNYNANNKFEKIVRFYIRKSPIQLLISAPHIASTPITELSPLNDIAVNLNLDSLKASFKRLGWYINLDLEDPRTDIDIFDRKEWEPRSVNYPMYRSLFWVDGDDMIDEGGTMVTNRLTRYDRDQITSFLQSGTFSVKKNLVFSSQEVVRNESSNYADWVKNTLSAKMKNPLSPLGTGVAYNNEYVGGVIIGRDQQFKVMQTQFLNDVPPYPGTFTIDNSGIGNSLTGLIYKKYLGDDPANNIYVSEAQRLASIVTSYFKYNVVHTGIDWRHWANLDAVLRGMLDYLENNDGYVVPVDLLSFEAVPAGKRVDLSWRTASENNSSNFVIEKAVLTETGKTEFTGIETIDAVGNSSVITNYGPIVDNNVNYNSTYIYRLKMVDRNGEFKYSNEKVVTLNGNAGRISLSEISPNPARDKATIEVISDNAVNASISVVDLNGNEVYQIHNGSLNTGVNSMVINLSTLSSGAYNIILKTDNVVLTTKLNVVK